MKEINLTQGKVALVDDEDFEELSQYKWFAQKAVNTFYAERVDMTTGKPKKIKMHREIMKTHKGMETDHIDHNGLNNCKSNLRNVTHRQNGQNRGEDKSSKYAGVSWHKVSMKWSARIRINKKRKYLGYFDTELEAHHAYLNELKEIGELFVDDI